MSKSALTATNSLLASLATDEGDTEASKSLPFLGFHSKKSNRAFDVKSDIPAVTEGQAFVFDGQSYRAVDSISILGGDLKYAAEVDNDGKILRAAASAPKGDADLKDSVLAMVLVYSGDQIIPTVSTFRATKTRVVQDIVSYAEKATDDWVKAQGPVGKLLAGLPTRLRSCGVLLSVPKTSKAGFAYSLGRAQGRLLTDKEAELLANAIKSEAFNGRLADLQEAFNKRRDLILSIINA